MKRKIAVLSALLLAVIAFSVTSASANVGTGHKVIPAGVIFTNFALATTNASSPECMYSDGTVGDSVFGHSYPTNCPANNPQTYFTQYDNACNGGHFVTSNCPFTSGSGLNTKWQGDPIIDIINTSTLWFVSGSGSGNTDLIQRAQPPGFEWVADGSFTSTTGAELINVYNSDQNGPTTRAACSEGDNQKLKFENDPASSTARCFWFEG